MASVARFGGQAVVAARPDRSISCPIRTALELAADTVAVHQGAGIV